MTFTEGIGYGPGWHYITDFIDMTRACFYAVAKGNVYSTLPMEYSEKGCAGNWESQCTELGAQA